MRMRISFKLHGDNAEVARRFSEITGRDIGQIAEVALLKYFDDVIKIAKEKEKEMLNGKVGESSNDLSGTGNPAQDTIHSETP